MAFGTMLSNATLQRPRAIFTLGIVTLCVTLLLSYERLRSYAFGPFPDLVVPSTADENDDNIVISKTDKLLYQFITDSIGTISYGTAVRPHLKGMPELVIDTLPERFIPRVDSQNTTTNDGNSVPARRLIIIGDVHGQKQPLEDLLAKLAFDNNNGDHLIFTGDLVNKGPDSAGVVAMAMELGAHSVRGNHEDRVLLAHAAMNRRKKLSPTDAEASFKALEAFQPKEGGESDAFSALKAYQAAEDALSKGDQGDHATAQALSDKQIEWLSALPLVLRIGSIPLGTQQPAFENVLVVHAGLVPKVPLEAQDPWAVMNMRTITYPIDEIRREAIKKFLLEKAKAKSEGKGTKARLKAIQDVDGDLINSELKKMSISQGFEPGVHIDDVGLPSETRDGQPWYEEWSAYQEMLAGKKRNTIKKDVVDVDDDEDVEDTEEEEWEDEQIEESQESTLSKTAGPVTTVVYGHDAKSGLQVPETYRKGKRGYTFGLDTGCVYGRSLTALVIELRDGSVVHEIVQVDCKTAVDMDN